MKVWGIITTYKIKENKKNLVLKISLKIAL